MPDTLLDTTLAAIVATDDAALAAAEAHQLDLTKPPGALGRLETVGNRLAAIAGTCPPPYPTHPVTTIFAGDHGVCAHRISPWPQEVTVQMAANMASGGAACAVLSREMGAEIVVTDVGIAADMSAYPHVVNRKVRPGTDDFTAGPAMTRDDARRAVQVGIATVDEAVARGADIVLLGEMGIGNTTTAAALVAALTGRTAAQVAGRGAGADDAMLARKVDVIARGLTRHRDLEPADGLGALAAYGGLEIGAMTGAILGGARHRIPVVVDGVIAAASALVAVALKPEARGYLVAGHLGVEPGIRAALDVLGLTPLVDLDLRLGEATGALMALPAIRASVRILAEMATFSQAQVDDSGRTL